MNCGSWVVPAFLSLYHHQAAVLTSEPEHSVSHPEAWYQTKTKGLSFLLISTTCVFVIQPLQPQMISCVLLRIFWYACITKTHVVLNKGVNPFVFVWYKASGWDTECPGWEDSTAVWWWYNHKEAGTTRLFDHYNYELGNNIIDYHSDETDFGLTITCKLNWEKHHNS